MIKPKLVMDRKAFDKNTAPPSAQPKSSSAKNHAEPPPSIVSEPEDGGERYSIGAFLGKGGFAVCYEGALARNGRVYAMKVVKSQMPQKKMEEKVCKPCGLGAYDRVLTFFFLFRSFGPNSKSTLKCDILLSFNFTAHSLLRPAHTSF
jgi:hypothetical protein